jgi:hypothetical protein
MIKKIYVFLIFSCLNFWLFGQEFIKINKSNLPLKYYFDGDTLQKNQKIDEFFTTDLITLGAYKTFLNALKIDSGETCYNQHLPKADKYEEEIIATYFSTNEFDNYPVIGVSWDNALDYCQWIGRKNGNLQKYTYRLPNVKEWLVIRHTELKKDLTIDSLFSEWTSNEMDESMYLYEQNNQLTFASGSTSKNPSSTHPALNRKIVLGDSFCEKFEYPINSSLRSYYANEGYKTIGFRIVRVKTQNK